MTRQYSKPPAFISEGFNNARSFEVSTSKNPFITEERWVLVGTRYIDSNGVIDDPNRCVIPLTGNLEPSDFDPAKVFFAPRIIDVHDAESWADFNSNDVGLAA